MPVLTDGEIQTLRPDAEKQYQRARDRVEGLDEAARANKLERKLRKSRLAKQVRQSENRARALLGT